MTRVVSEASRETGRTGRVRPEQGSPATPLREVQEPGLLLPKEDQGAGSESLALLGAREEGVATQQRSRCCLKLQIFAANRWHDDDRVYVYAYTKVTRCHAAAESFAKENRVGRVVIGNEV